MLTDVPLTDDSKEGLVAVLPGGGASAVAHLAGVPIVAAAGWTGTTLLAAVLTVAAFDVGMVGWTLLLHFNDWMPPVSQGTFWFLMQLGVLVGLMTGYPVVRWLLGQRPIRRPPAPIGQTATPGQQTT